MSLEEAVVRIKESIVGFKLAGEIVPSGTIIELGLAYRNLGLVALSDACLLELKEGISKHSLPSENFQIHLHLADNALIRNDYAQALLYLQAFEESDPELFPKVDQAHIYRALAMAYQGLDDLVQAEQYFLKAIQYNLEAGQEWPLLEDYCRLGTLYHQWGNIEKAKANFNQATGAFPFVQDHLLGGFCALQAGIFYANIKEYDLAWQYLKEAGLFYKEAMRRAAVFCIHLLLAHLELEQGNPDGARAFIYADCHLDLELQEAFFKREILTRTTLRERIALLSIIDQLLDFTKEMLHAGFLYENYLMIGFWLSQTVEDYERAFAYAETYCRKNMVRDASLSALHLWFELEQIERQQWPRTMRRTLKVLGQEVQSFYLSDYGFPSNRDLRAEKVTYYWMKAEKLYRSGNKASEALTELEIILDLARVSGNRNLAKIYGLSAQLHLALSERKEAEKQVRKALRCWEQEAKSTDALPLLAELALWAQQFGDIELEAYALLVQADIHKNEKQLEACLKNYERLCALALALKRLPLFDDYFDASLVLLQELSKENLYLRFYEAMASLLASFDPPRAEVYLKLCVRRADEEKDPLLLARVYQKLHFCAGEQKETKASPSYQMEALRLYLQVWDEQALEGQEKLDLLENLLTVLPEGMEEARKDLWAEKGQHALEMEDFDRVLDACTLLQNVSPVPENLKYLAMARQLSAEVDWRMNRHVSAVESFKKAIRLYQDGVDLQRAAWSSYRLGQLYLELGETKPAGLFLQKAMTWSAGLSEWSAYVVYAFEKAKCYQAEGHRKEAETLFWTGFNHLDDEHAEIKLQYLEALAAFYAEEEAPQLQEACLLQGKLFAFSDQEKVQVHYALASFYLQQGQYADAIPSYQEASNCAEASSSVVDQAVHYNDMALCYARLGEDERALEFFTKAWKALPAEEENVLKIMVFQNIAYHAMHMEKYEDALRYYSNCLFYYTRTLDEEKLAEIYLQMADVYEEQQNHKDAEKYLFVAARWAERSQVPTLIFQINLKLALWFMEQGAASKARVYFVENMRLAKQIDEVRELFLAHYEMGIYLLDRGNLTDAKALLQEAEEIARKENWTEELALVEVALQDVEEAPTLATNDAIPTSGFKGKAATQKQIDRCINDLFDHDLVVPPQDYFHFLQKMNGWAFNGYELFGTEAMEGHRSLFAYNLPLKDLQKFKEKAVLGSGDEDLILFNRRSERYEVVDRMDHMVFEDFKTFKDLFAYLNALLNH